MDHKFCQQQRVTSFLRMTDSANESKLLGLCIGGEINVFTTKIEYRITHLIYIISAKV